MYCGTNGKPGDSTVIVSLNDWLAGGRASEQASNRRRDRLATRVTKTMAKGYLHLSEREDEEKDQHRENIR